MKKLIVAILAVVICLGASASMAAQTATTKCEKKECCKKEATCKKDATCKKEVTCKKTEGCCKKEASK